MVFLAVIIVCHFDELNTTYQRVSRPDKNCDITSVMKLHWILWEAEKKVGLSKVPLTVDVLEMSRLVSVKPVGFNLCFLSKVEPITLTRLC